MKEKYVRIISALLLALAMAFIAIAPEISKNNPEYAAIIGMAVLFIREYLKGRELNQEPAVETAEEESA